MRYYLPALLALLFAATPCVYAQKAMPVAVIKDSLQKTDNPPLFVKDVLKKKFRLDTGVVTHITHFNNLADSLAYTGKIKKVYGPFTQNGKRFLIQILAKLPNTFYHV